MFEPRRDGRRRRAWPLAVLLIALAGVLAGCASIPMSGPVVAGPDVDGDTDPGLRFQAFAPAEGASPRAIIGGFLLAASSVEEDHQVARAYLDGMRAEQWRPSAGTTVFENGTATLTLTQDGRELTEDAGADPTAGPVRAVLTFTARAVVDEGGRYQPLPPGTTERVDLTLHVVDGEWRIAEIPDGLLIDQAGFTLAFSSYALYFVDPTLSFLVPEVRWFAERRSIATTLTGELLRGPSTWLAGAVRTGFPPGSRLSPPAAVTVEDGEAQVDLTRQVLRASPDDRAVMQAQLQATLRPVPAVSTVRMTVESGELVLPGTLPALVQDPTVDPSPVVVTGDGLAEVTRGGLARVSGLPPLGGRTLTDPGKGAAAYAALTAGRTALLHLVPGTTSTGDPLLTGTALTAPSFDPRNWIWSTSAACTGVVTAVRPGEGVADVEAPWLAGRRISSLRISRDGTRAVIASTDADGRGHVDLAGVRRLADGRPLSLDQATEISALPSLQQVTEAVWVSETQIAVLGRRAEDAEAHVYLSQPLGQTVLIQAAVPDDAETVGIAAGSGERSVVAVTADGSFWQRAGAEWVQVDLDQPVSDAAFAG